jgi:hypothetical protein
MNGEAVVSFRVNKAHVKNHANYLSAFGDPWLQQCPTERPHRELGDDGCVATPLA